MGKGKIEDMPIGARYVGFFVDGMGDAIIISNEPGQGYISAGLNKSVSVKPDRIDVSDQGVTLLSFVGLGSRGRPSFELNIKRGTLVAWEME